MIINFSRLFICSSNYFFYFYLYILTLLNPQLMRALLGYKSIVSNRRMLQLNRDLNTIFKCPLDDQ
jgi:hypothetical protein